MGRMGVSKARVRPCMHPYLNNCPTPRKASLPPRDCPMTKRNEKNLPGFPVARPTDEADSASPLPHSPDESLVREIRELIETSRGRVAASVHAELSLLYWKVGRRINKEILGDRRAEYGRRLVEGLAERLTAEFGSGWDVKTLRHCLRAAETFSEREIVSAARRQLSWTHIKTLLYIDDPLKREFYAEMCALEHWSTRTLAGRIDSMLYERTAIAKKPEEVVRRDLAALRDERRMSADLAFRDPYLLDFLGLSGTYSEKDLENAIVSDMRGAILELGADMAFLSQQKRISVDGEDYYLDLLFFHRRLRCLVAIDLKLGAFKAEFKGQMELYLRWLAENESCPGENPPIGLILCAGKNDEHVRLLRLGESNIRVASYLTELPPREILERRFRLAIESARLRAASDAP